MDYLSFHNSEFVLWTLSNFIRKTITHRIVCIILFAHKGVHRLLVYNFVSLGDHLRSLTLRLQFFIMHLPINLFLHSLRIHILLIFILNLFCPVIKSNRSLAFLSAIWAFFLLAWIIILNIKLLYLFLLSQLNILNVLKLDLFIWILDIMKKNLLLIESTGNRIRIKYSFGLWYSINFIFLCFTDYWSIIFNLWVLRHFLLWLLRAPLCVSMNFIFLFKIFILCFL